MEVGLGPEHDRAEPRCGVFLHAGRVVAVDVERDRDRRVPEPFRHDLRMHTFGEKQRCVSVPQVMEPDSGDVRAGDPAVECLRERFVASIVSASLAR